MLLRYARATNYDLKAATEMFVNYARNMENRNMKNMFNRIEKYTRDYQIKESCSQTNYFSVCKKGWPIRIDRWSVYQPEKILELNDDNKMDMLIHEVDSEINAIFPICSKLAGRRIDRELWIHDLADANLKWAWKKKQREFVTSMMNFIKENYPEMTGEIWIVNASPL